MSRFLVLPALILCLTVPAVASEVKPIKEVFEPQASLYPENKYGKVAVVAWNATAPAPITESQAVAEAYKKNNRETLARYITEAAKNGARLVITPEFGVMGYPDLPELPPEEDNFQSPEQIAPYAESVPGKSTEFFSALAKKLKVYVHFGLAEKSGSQVYNAVVVVGPDGEIVAKYRKIHLFDGEDAFLTEGDQPVTYQSPFGKVGLIICSDVYSSFPMDDYKRQKVDVLALSTSWAQYNTGWDFFTRGARQVGAYLLAANQIYFPDSGVIEPSGKAQSHIRQSQGIAYGYLPLKGKDQ